jgi:exo-1,4-beta-D-glucosaminidase
MVSSPFACLVYFLLVTIFTLAHFTDASFTVSPGQITAIPSWTVQSSSKVLVDISKLSSPSFNTSSWYTVGSHGTLMSALLSNNVYTDTSIFYSTNLQQVDTSPFQVPWFYRSTFTLPTRTGSHFQLKTHGITSRADIYLNGQQIAKKEVQTGAYSGLTYDVSSVVKQENVLIVKVYPTDYNRDFALGFVDWNPYPPDNGTGIWRDVEIRHTGPVSLSLPRVITTLDGQVTLKLDVKNWKEKDVHGEVTCKVFDDKGKQLGYPRAEFRLQSGRQRTVGLSLKVTKPEIWWPKQWGAQPIYTTSCVASTDTGISDITEVVKFGIRIITSELNTHNDTVFSINGKPFQVLGAGYTSDVFLRFDEKRLRTQFEYMLDMGLNTVRLEGKQEHPTLYTLADELGLMVMAGWECCDKWEGWSYNDEGSGVTWTSPDYVIANNSMRHEAEMMQHHPSMLAFLVGSDFWPDDKATGIYVDALKAFDWNVPIIASASQRGFPNALGNGGMKMDGPYDWVSPNYWYDEQNRLGSAFGFGSELGAGVGTPEFGSLKKFLSSNDLEDLWKAPNKGLYHMSTNVSSFYTREIYNTGLWRRYGAPTSLSHYLLEAQMADYEATRAQFEAYATRRNAERPATGLIYWMLNNAWPSLHWNLFDFYLRPAGAFFGVKTASRVEHVAYDYEKKEVYLINKSLAKTGARKVDIELIGLDGTVVHTSTVSTNTSPNESKLLSTTLAAAVAKMKNVSLLRLILSSSTGVLSRNVYWLSTSPDVPDWENSTWYHTPLTAYANFTSISTMSPATVSVTTGKGVVILENTASVPAVFVRLELVDAAGNDILPVTWEDNYLSLWPGEKMELAVRFEGIHSGAKVQYEGRNVKPGSVAIGAKGRY